MSRSIRIVLLAMPLALTAACSSPSNTGTPTPDAGTVVDTGALGADTGTAQDVPATLDAGGGTADAGPPPDPEAANIVPRLRLPAGPIQAYVAGESNSTYRCELDEACVTPSTNRVLRFDLVTPNAGPGDLYLGPPTAGNRPREGFEYSACHRHYHLLGYAEYDLLDMDGHVVAGGHKQSFCLEDTGRDNQLAAMGIGRTVPAAERWGCANQGIHAGYYDLYYSALPCQFIDITNVPAGHYRIRARVNTRHLIPESNYDDNTAYIEVDVPDGTPVPTANAQNACTSSGGVDQDCGWSPEDNARYCTPGETVTVGCNSACSPGVGRCEGDTMIRVCPANSICLHGQAIASNDDSCGNSCSSVTFTCPTVGQFRVLFSARGGAGQCVIDETRSGS